MSTPVSVSRSLAPLALCLADRRPRRAGYELHPSFHGQGLMSEAMEASLRYSFDVLRLPAVKIDPRSTNEASIALAKKFGGVFGKTTVAAHHMGVSQDVYWVNREEWCEAEETRERGTKERPSEEASFGCRW